MIFGFAIHVGNVVEIELLLVRNLVASGSGPEVRKRKCRCKFLSILGEN